MQPIIYSLLKQLFWYIRLPQLVVTALLISMVALYMASYEQAAFIGVVLICGIYIAWSSIILQRMITTPTKHLLAAVTKGALEMSSISHSQALPALAGVTTLFECLEQSLKLNKESVSQADLSIFKQHEQEIIEARDRAEAANISKDSFIANISHELRTPLNAILGFCEMLRFTEMQPKQQEYLEYIHSCGQSLLAIVNELLDLSAIAQGRLIIVIHPFNLYKMLRDVSAGFELRAREKNLEFVVDFDESMPRYFMGDGNKLRQIVANLLNNAIRFTEEGYIKLNVSPLPNTKNNRAGIIDFRITVEDSGIGVPAEKTKIIFERFSQADNSMTRKYSGTGLGLAICRELLELMHGNITYMPNNPSGSCFVVDVSMEQTNVLEFEPLTASERKEACKDHRLQVLVVEDDFHNMALIKEFLSRTTVNIFTADNGLEALSIMEKHKMDIVLLDISMPVMEGVETISNIRRTQTTDPQGRPVFVAAMTANAMKGDEKRYRDIGFDEYVAKPVSFNAIVGLLERHSGIPLQHIVH
jgi:signal transduction histidine kinase/ActR/RegA family two-component response regulator